MPLTSGKNHRFREFSLKFYNSRECPTFPYPGDRYGAGWRGVKIDSLAQAEERMNVLHEQNLQLAQKIDRVAARLDEIVRTGGLNGMYGGRGGYAGYAGQGEKALKICQNYVLNFLGTKVLPCSFILKKIKSRAG